MTEFVLPEESIFLHALEVPSPEERAAYLDGACGADRQLRAAVQALLRTNDQSGDLLDLPERSMALPGRLRGAIEAVLPRSPLGPTDAVDEAALPQRPGTVIGPYKLVQSIGEGGMGTVWLAEQTEPVQRKVALKLIKSGLDSRQVLARFEAERQALALMDHPNIAKVLDAGTTQAHGSHSMGLARPYIVMELVQGVPITRYCDEHHLTPRERLELFVPVCQAVQHAHQKGIIHRDLKPSNVLVCLYDGQPVPKVIDFGVAKAIGPKLTDRSLVTEFGQVVGTLEYMSPEQADLNPLDIDTRSDIYSLGVLLYELLTGTTPLQRQRLQGVGLLEALRRVREEETPKPSARLSTTAELPATAANRGLGSKKLSGVVRGELDWTVLKALEKDRNRRYESANGLARDLERYLHNEPVQACPPSAWYRFRKFARRHKAALGVAVCVCLGAVLLAVSNVQLQVAQGRVEAARSAEADQRRRAEDNLELALQALDEIFLKPAEDEVSARDSQGRPPLTTRDLEHLDRHLLQKGLGFYEQFAQANRSNPRLRGETGKAYNRVGYLHVTLRQYDRAETAFRTSISILEKAAEESPEVPGFRRTLVSDYHWLGHVLKSTDRPREAEELLRRNVAASELLVADYPKVADYRFHLYHACRALGDFFKETGRSQEAELPYRRSIDVAQQLAGDFRSVATYRDELSSAWRGLGHLLKENRRYQEAGEAFGQAAEAGRQFVADFATDPRARSEQYFGCRALGDALTSAGRFQDAVAPYRQAVDLARQLVADSPDVAEHRRNLLLSERTLARLLLHLDRFPEAEQVYRQTIALDEKVAASANLAADRVGPPETHAALGDLLCVTGRFREAAEEYRRALEARPTYREFQWKLAWFLANCPDPQYRDPTRAIALGKKIAELPQEEVEPAGSSLGAGAERQGFYWRALGVAYFRTGDWDNAITCLEKSRELQAGLCTCGWSVLAMAHWQRGDKEEALRCYERGYGWLEKFKGGYSKEPGFYWEDEFRRFRAEAAAGLGMQDPGQPAGGEASPSKTGP